jgi:hypothetical protein
MREREELRRAAAEQPGFYSPAAHLLIPAIGGLAIVIACALALRAVRPWELGFAAFVFVLSNAVEWRTHRDVLHKRFAPLGVLYDRHTPVHHRIYVAGDMEMRNPREFRLVLLPAYGIFAILLITAPPAALLYSLGQRNLGLIYLIVTTSYVLLYEWLHLAYHLPERYLIGPFRVIRSLRRHHEVHHDPANMQKGNFNVTVPLWDWVRGTTL